MSANNSGSLYTKNRREIHASLDWVRHSLRVDGTEFGHLLNDSIWRFMGLLALLRKAGAVLDEDVLPAHHVIGDQRIGESCAGNALTCARQDGRIIARNARRELGRALPDGLAKLLVQCVKGRGYRLRPNIKVRGRGAPRISYRRHLDGNPAKSA
jgi:hypothetical protein